MSIFNPQNTPFMIMMNNNSPKNEHQASYFKYREFPVLYYKLLRFKRISHQLLHFLNGNLFLNNSITIQPVYLSFAFQNAFMCGKSTTSHDSSNTQVHQVPTCCTKDHNSVNFISILEI